MKYANPFLFTMHRPRGTRCQHRSRSCPPNLKLCAEPGARSRGRIIASNPLTSRPNVLHSREGTNKHTHHHVAPSHPPVQRPDSRWDVNPHAKNGLPRFQGHGRAYGPFLGVGPYWNPPRTTITNNPTATGALARGRKITDCSWMRPEAAADTTTAATTWAEIARYKWMTPEVVADARARAAHYRWMNPEVVAAAEAWGKMSDCKWTRTETATPTDAREEPEWRDSPPAAKKRHRPRPREAWPSHSSKGSMSYLSRHAKGAEATAAENCTTMVLHRRCSDGSRPSSSGHSQGGRSAGPETAFWDPLWDTMSGIGDDNE
ncbi:hypothetical protein F5B21DRAFT_160594 [Xylaria acuta]|nr:hypothetical protein F5B21DRAFT_160594 [Xylaria acuta]